jgi:hypothetical protein
VEKESTWHAGGSGQTLLDHFTDAIELAGIPSGLARSRQALPAPRFITAERCGSKPGVVADAWPATSLETPSACDLYTGH